MIKFIAALSMALAITGGTAQAATLTCVGAKATLSVGDALDKHCGLFNNPGATEDYTFTTIDTDPITFTKVTDSSYVNVTNPIVKFDDLIWSITTTKAVQYLAIFLKQSTDGAAFLISGPVAANTVLSGTWSSSGPGQSQNDLSHAEFYYVAGSPTTVVPVPAAGLLLLGGLGGFAALKRRRRA